VTGLLWGCGAEPEDGQFRKTYIDSPFRILSGFPDPLLGESIHHEFPIWNGPGGSFTVRIASGSLPKGLSLERWGAGGLDDTMAPVVIIGTPEQPGPFEFTLEVEDYTGAVTAWPFRGIVRAR